MKVVPKRYRRRKFDRPLLTKCMMADKDSPGSKAYMFIEHVIINRNFSGLSGRARSSAGKTREVAIDPLISI